MHEIIIGISEPASYDAIFTKVKAGQSTEGLFIFLTDPN
jgi:hypothetical protein